MQRGPRKPMGEDFKKDGGSKLHIIDEEEQLQKEKENDVDEEAKMNVLIEEEDDYDIQIRNYFSNN